MKNETVELELMAMSAELALEEEAQEVREEKNGNRATRRKATAHHKAKKSRTAELRKAKAEKIEREVKAPGMWVYYFESNNTVFIPAEKLWKAKGKQRRENKAICRKYYA